RRPAPYQYPAQPGADVYHCVNRHLPKPELGEQLMEPYVGDIRMFAGVFSPVGYAFCNGQSLAISSNEALYSLIGTLYGGDGASSFNVPGLQGRIPVHVGTASSGGSI